MIWTILGIKETKDKKAISRAYKERLASTNPEEKPEEFKELRAAYEEAMALADKEEKPDADKTDIELWRDQLEALYNYLPDRLDVGAWSRLLDSEICQALDTRSQAEETMLEFFKQNYHVPHDVMVYLNEHFGFTDRMDELKEKFPADFLEYVIESRVRYDDNFPMDLFSPGLDGKAADVYEVTYRKVYNTDPAEIEPLLDTLRNSSEKHPYGEALLCKVRLNNDDMSAVDDMADIQKAHPTDDHLSVDLIIAYEKAGRMELVEELANQVIERNPDYLAAKRYKAEAVAARGDYKEAVDIIQHLMSSVTGEQKTYYELDILRRRWNDAMMEDLKVKLGKDPEDADSLYEMLWCLIQNDRSAEAQELVEKLPFEKPDPFGYYNVKSVLAGDAKDLEKALEYTRDLLVAVENLKPDGTKKTEERMARRTEVVGRIANILFELGQQDEALRMSEEATDFNTADLGSLFNLLSLHLNAKNYERADEIARIILDREPGNSGALFLMAMANFKMGKDNIAFEAVNDAIDQDGSSLPFYLLKLRILVRNRAYEAATELINFLEQNGITENTTVDYCKLYMFANQEDEKQSKTQEEYDAILDLAAGVDQKISADDAESPEWAAHFYYLYSLVTADRQDFDKEYPVEPIITILDKGIAKDPEFYSCLSYKAWLLKKNKQTEEALAIYKKLEQTPGHNLSVETNLGEIYYDDLKNHAEDALRYYRLLIESNPENADNYFFAGMCCFRMEQPEEACKYFELEQKYGPDDIDGYFRNTYSLLKLNKLEEAVENGKKAVEIAKTRKEKDTVRFWNPLILAYRRMGKVQEALDAVNDCAEHNPDWDARQKIFSIYMQFGMFDEAHEHISKWRRQRIKNRDTNGWTTAKTQLLMAEDKPGKLHYHLIDFKGYIAESDAKNAHQLISASKGWLEQYLKEEEIYYNSKAANNEAGAYHKGNYAWALFVAGQTEKAQELAAETLMEEDKELKQATGMSLLHKTRRLRLLAIAGFEKEAREAAEDAAMTPLCETCEYCSCKDLDLFKCQIEYILGNYEKAAEMIQECRAKWPDEADFIELEYLIKTKGKK